MVPDAPVIRSRTRVLQAVAEGSAGSEVAVHRLTTDELGRRGDRRYFLTVAVDPDPSTHHTFDPYEDAKNWCVTIHFPGDIPSASDTEIARIDTYHGTPHFDKLFLPDQPKVGLSEDYSLHRAERHLVARWREFAEQYDLHHDSSRR